MTLLPTTTTPRAARDARRGVAMLLVLVAIAVPTVIRILERAVDLPGLDWPADGMPA